MSEEIDGVWYSLSDGAINEWFELSYASFLTDVARFIECYIEGIAK
jgi:hypothetical protein